MSSREAHMLASADSSSRLVSGRPTPASPTLNVSGTSSRVPFRISLALLFATTASFFLQSSGGGVFTSKVLADSHVDSVNISVGAACSVTANVTSAHTATLYPGEYSGTFSTGSSTPYADGIGSTRLTVFCNDAGGYSIYAIGYTNDTEGTTTLIGQSTNQTIITGTATSGNTSNWAMKLAKVTDDTISYNPTSLTIENNFDSFHAVPDTYTKVASYTSTTDRTLGSVITTTYAAYIEPSQVADTYVGKVKYTLVHPSTHDLDHYYINFYASGGTGTPYSQEVTKGSSIYLKGNHFTKTLDGNDYYFKGWSTTNGSTTITYRAGERITPTEDLNLYAVWAKGTGEKLYDVVASLTKGVQLNNTDPKMGIKANPITMNGSGVYTYNSEVFGESSDAGSNPIYYYRGILDDDLDGTENTYGSNGNSANYPNYVKLTGPNNATTCWRIVRTTGSKGVKLIYNGLYGATTANSCANAQGNAQYGTRAFLNSAYGSFTNIVNVGYTFNDDYSSSSATTPQTYDTLFGTNVAYSSNDTNSYAKDAIEGSGKFYDTYLDNYAITELGDSAGYCNDRSLGEAGVNTWTSMIDGSTLITPYGTSNMPVYNFGGAVRISTQAQLPTLNCPRGTVDLYSVNGATTGNGQLSKPAALLTADEAVFAGSGQNADNGSAYNANSFLRSGSIFWLLTPFERYTGGYARVLNLNSYGTLGKSDIYNTFGVRPVISLTSTATISSGSGTATDPWEISW